jgi:UDP-N-acetylmuramoyl-L-alanyl-D-glutamate--2,6-diaminopimelate ligase
MQLTELLQDVPGIVATAGPTETPITRIVSDSRQVVPGALFVAYRGVGTDAHRYISDAVSRGATAIVGETPPDEAAARAATYVQVADGRAALGWLCAAWEGHPSRALALVGVTGTDGKTTTANLLYAILRAASRSTGLISTVNAVIGDTTYDTGLHTTTPDAADVQHYLSEMRAVGTEVGVLEVTSHGLAQHRVTGCLFDVAIVTNITHEHLDFHGDYAGYRAAKAMLFRSLTGQPPHLAAKPGVSQPPKTAVLNRDDSSFEYLAALPVERTFTYGRGPAAGTGTHLTAHDVTHSPGGLSFTVAVTGDTPAGLAPFPVRSVLVGDFNVSNILAASAAALALGLAPDAIAAGVAAMTGIPGRMERLDRGQPFTAIVDFAHTPNALVVALDTVRGLAGREGSVICVFGSAGLRDREKRRLMGQVAARRADFTVVTAEDPRTEELAAIMAETTGEMEQLGHVAGRDFVAIPDRQRAILYAVQHARPGDVVVVCGKGHEQSMCFGTVEHPWRDQDALAWALDQLQDRAPATPPFVLPTW